MSAKISTMKGHGGGMGHLIDQAEGEQEIRGGGVIPEWPKDKCVKLRCILEGVDYYIPNGSLGATNEPPYHPIAFDVGYSAVFSPANLIEPVAINKHVQKRFYQTGIATEIVDLPKWWDRRDEGV